MNCSVVFCNDRKEISIKKGDLYRSFVPGDFDDVEKFAPSCLNEVKKLWTKEVVSDWENNYKWDD